MPLPLWSGNYLMPVVRVGMGAMFCPKADTKPYVAATILKNLSMVN